MSDPHENLAEQALANLVNQFARPLDFLRELVQNSIDAGSPRIAVTIDFDPPEPGEAIGVTRILVEDWGEGMDQEIIDNQLTRLFASNKEGDLTKIGKFGIGFTSIFAINPEAVLLRTGRHGENWELLFHKDRSFTTTRYDQPVDGTKITLFKRMNPDEVDRFVSEARFILTYWCEHSNVPVTFWDRTAGAQVTEVDGDDPFAAFEDEGTTPDPNATSPEPVNHPLDVEADLRIRKISGDVEVVVGIASQPVYGFYNGGLTLLRTRSTDALGRFTDPLRHLLFKVKNDALEHTLTRDNVLQDSHWEHAMEVVLEARLELATALIDRLDSDIRSGEPHGRWQHHLARLADQPDIRDAIIDAGDKFLFRGVLGDHLTLKAITAAQRQLGVVMVSNRDDALTHGVREHQQIVVEDTPACRELLMAAQRPSLFADIRSSAREIRLVEEVFVVPQVLENSHLDDQERKLMANTEELLKKSVGRRLNLGVGDFGGAEPGATEALALSGAQDSAVFQRPSRGFFWRWLPAIFHRRTMLVNRHHPLFRAQLLASTESPWLAAAGLASALLHEEAIEGGRTHRLMLALAHTRLEVSP